MTASRFAGLKGQTTKAAASPAPEPPAKAAKAGGRGKMIGGYFSEDLSRVIRSLAVEEGVTVQALVGEGLDAVLKARGKHAMGER